MIKHILLFPYHLIRWAILLTILFSLIVLMSIEKPSITLALIKAPLKTQGVEYGSIRGGVLSGFTLYDVNYKNQLKAKEITLKVDLNRLEDRLLYINNIAIKGVEIEKNFLASLIEDNRTKDQETSQKTALPFDRIILNHATITLDNIVYKNYRLNHAVLKVKDLNSDMKSQHKGDLYLILDSNITQLRGNASINNKNLTVVADIIPNRNFLLGFVHNKEITMHKDPHFKLNAQGSIDGKIAYQLSTRHLDLQQSNHTLQSKKLQLMGTYNIKNKDLYAHLQSDLLGNMATLQLKSSAKLNIDDINKTLNYNLDGTLLPQAPFINELLKEQNISLDSSPKITINSQGDLNKLTYHLHLNKIKLHQNNHKLHQGEIDLAGEYSINQHTLEAQLKSDLNSSLANLTFDAHTQCNLKDINSSLLFETQGEILAKKRFLNNLLLDHNITITQAPRLNFEAKGGLEELTLQLNGKSALTSHQHHSKIHLKSTPITLNLKEHHIKGAINFSSPAKDIGLSLKSQFEGDYTHPQTIQTKSDIKIDNFNAFGINLSPLVPIQLHLENHEKDATLNLSAKRIKIHAKTEDYDHYSFDIKSRNIYLYKMIELPPELDHKFIKVDLQGHATLSKSYFDIQGVLHSNKKFKATIQAHNSEEGLNASLRTKHLLLHAQGDLQKRDIQAKLTIDSLKQLQKELNALYAFDKVDVDGRVEATAKIKGESIRATLHTPKLKFDEFNIERLKIDAQYQKNLLTLNQFQFDTTGFKDKTLNKNFYLNQKGEIHLGDRRDIIIDMHPNILIKMRGNQAKLEGKIKIKKLPLSYPAYGNLLLSSDIDYLQEGKRKSIIGEITLRKMKLFYEAKFLDPANDPDVVIITKKDKKRKAEAQNSFVNDMLIDLKIKAPQANYKTADIDLLFDLNLKVNKSFGEDLALLGKVEDINGHVDQVPKRFMVVNSTIVFKGDKRINPLLDIHVEYELPQVMIHITIGGDANHPKLEFTSEPPMPKKDIMSYLLLGVSTASLAEGEGSLSREAELFILNQAARDLAYELDLDRIFIKDDGTSEGFAIEAGKKISPKNMVIIESSKEGNSFILEHNINKNIKLRIGQHQKENPSQSIDIYFRKKFR